MFSFCIFTSFIVLGHTLEDNRPVVETSLGTIRGHYKTSYDGRAFSAFEGIPYAKPPVGDLRFQPPQESEPWTGTWNAIALQTCAQVNINETRTRIGSIGNEDCLYLNVYVPTERTNRNMDVVVFIYGGAFMFGDTEFAGPELLMDRNIVFVTINYRLGVLGFLYTEDNSVSGNNGMKDQMMALKWIQSHIHNFRGNPNSVTITGMSSGAATVHLHYFSPLAKGLFHRGISNSATALAPWAIQEAPLLVAEKLAKHVGCPTKSTTELVECFKQRPAHDLMRHSFSLFKSFRAIPMTPFGPVVEKKREGAYLTDLPYQLLLKGDIHDVPWICSFTSEEGMTVLLQLNVKIETLREQWNNLLPLLLEYDRSVHVKHQDEVSKKVKQFYYGDEVNDNVVTLIKLYGDRAFYCNIELATRLQAKVNKSPVYSYMFGYDGDHVAHKKFLGLDKTHGVNHGEDSHYYYNVTYDGKPVTYKEMFNEKAERIKDLMLDVIVSFAKNGKPIVKNVHWEPFNGDSEDFCYLSINNDGIKMDARKELAPTQFWRSLPIHENVNMNRVGKDEL